MCIGNIHNWVCNFDIFLVLCNVVWNMYELYSEMWKNGFWMWNGLLVWNVTFWVWNMKSGRWNLKWFGNLLVLKCGFEMWHSGSGMCCMKCVIWNVVFWVWSPKLTSYSIRFKEFMLEAYYKFLEAHYKHKFLELTRHVTKLFPVETKRRGCKQMNTRSSLHTKHIVSKIQ